MIDAGGNAIDLDNFVVFVVFKVGESLNDNIYWPPFVISLRVGPMEVLKAASGLGAKEVREATLMIESVIGGIGQDLLLLDGIRRGRLRKSAA